MPRGIAHVVSLPWQALEAGFCRHPEISTRRDGGWKSCDFPALVFLVEHPEYGYLLFDTGYSRHFLAATRPFPERLYVCVTPVTLRAGGSVREQLMSRGIDAAGIRHVFISHFHGDHVGGLPDFPAARIYCAREAWDDLTRRSRWSRVRNGLLRELAPAELAPRLTFFEDLPALQLAAELTPFDSGRDLFGDGTLAAIALPGHAAGHWGLSFHDGKRRVFLLGDAAWSSDALRAGHPPPRLTTSWLGDTAGYRQTFDALHRIAVERPDVLLVPSHCSEFRP